MDPEKKPRRLLQRLGVPGSAVEIMTDEERAELAAMYDTHVAPIEELPKVFGEFWAMHQARLEKSKATSEGPGDRGQGSEDLDVEPAEVATEELTGNGTELNDEAPAHP